MIEKRSEKNVSMDNFVDLQNAGSLKMATPKATTMLRCGKAKGWMRSTTICVLLKRVGGYTVLKSFFRILPTSKQKANSCIVASSVTHPSGRVFIGGGSGGGESTPDYRRVSNGQMGFCAVAAFSKSAFPLQW